MLQHINNWSREKKISVFLVIFFSVGAIGLGLPITRELFITLMPLSLLLGIGMMFWVHRNWNKKQVWIFILITLLGYFIEVAGVLTGEVFGSYQYGRALGIKLWETPPMIGMNWLMLIYAVYAILHPMTIHPVVKVLLGSTMMLIYDYIMEPVAMQLDMWDWAGGVIPLQNYIAWFIISAVMLGIFHGAKLSYRNKVAPVLFVVQVMFFLVLRVIV
jgi:bisanhydrobacterioruberin hydratase